ncbi:MAG: SBBP repeat-containing protein, partial [Pyrinomonadaceae bacterium]
DFPTVNAIQSANGSFQDAFVAKLNAAGTAFVYSTYLGGNGNEQARGIAVDSSGNAYVTGFTNSTDFPTANAFQATIGSNGDDIFVTKLNAAGTALVYSTYLGGGDSAEFGQSIAVDSAGNAYVTGSTFSTDYPVVNPIQSTKSGGSTDSLLTKINADGSALVYSTYLGGSGNDTGFDVAVDSAGNAYVTGNTASTDFPLANALQGTNSGGASDAFVTKVNAAGTALVYSTYLGGGDQDDGESIAFDSAGNAYITGNTFSTNFPTVNAIQPANGGTTITQDAFVTKINAAGTALVYSTYLGGTGGEIGFGIAVDSAGNAYIAGGTGSFTSFPITNSLQCSTGGGQDVFVTKLNAAGSAFVYSTYIGGSGTENGRGVALDSAGNAYVAGFTRSSNFPVVNAAQGTFGGDAIFGDAFALKLSDTSAGPVSLLQFTQTNFMVQEDTTFVTLTVQRTGDTSAPVTVDYTSANGTASERSDYTTAVGTLRFGAGETAKTLDILVNEDSKVEGTEAFTVNLSNPTGGASLSCQTATATIQIMDDVSEPSTNVIDDTPIFVGQQYHDFLNRQSDAGGQQFWENQITSCGTDIACINDRRVNVSAAFFLSVEFQRTGYQVIRIYKASFTDAPARPRGLPRYREFLRDTQEVSRGIVMGQPGADQQLEQQRADFARRWVQSTEFVAQFPTTMTADAFVDKLFLNSEVTPTPAERTAAINAFGAGGTEGRAAALLSVTDSNSVFNRQYNPAFVLMQYYGYLRRNPDDAPDNNFNGYDFWLTKLNQFSTPGENVADNTVALGRVRRAEMVKAFIVSIEYRSRFGQP